MANRHREVHSMYKAAQAGNYDYGNEDDYGDEYGAYGDEDYYPEDNNQY